MNADASALCDLSIIIVNWNTRSFLRACLESIDAHHDGLDVEV